MAFETYEILDGRYEVIGQIGNGGMSHVYHVNDQRTGKLFALKEIEKADATALSRQAYETERMFLKNVSHVAFPMLIDSFETSDSYCIVMEYIQGETLQQLLQRTGRMKAEEAYEIMWHLCDALAFLHGCSPRMIYGDLKPSNVIVLKNRTIKLIDFGSVQEETKRKQYVFGTREYAAPEQLSEEEILDARCDVYAFGAIYYELLTGQKFYGAAIENPFVDFRIREVIFNCTKSNRKKRYEDMQIVKKILKQKQKKQGLLPLPKKGKSPFLLQEMERTFLVER